jgi:hypothetical protein
MTVKIFIVQSPVEVNSTEREQTKVKRTKPGLRYQLSYGHACLCHTFTLKTKQPNLQLKNQPKQHLGYLPLSVTLPIMSLTCLSVFLV